MKRDNIKFAVFLIVQLSLYGVILTAGGTVLRISEFLAIVICFLYALLCGKQKSVIIGLACTVAADFCLVICAPAEQLWGMVFFLTAQTAYAIGLHSQVKNRCLVILRLAAILLAVILTVAVLGDGTDALALISLCYYANLILNIAAAFFNFQKDPVLPIALVLFLLCDTVVGLQVASGSYLAIREDSALYRLIFMDFNLAWFFYLPSQVLIALCSAKRRAK